MYIYNKDIPIRKKQEVYKYVKTSAESNFFKSFLLKYILKSQGYYNECITLIFTFLKS